MKKLLFVMALLLWVTFIAGCGNQTEVIENEDWEMVVVEETSEDEFEMTMKELYKEGGKMTCTMTSYEEGIEMNGTLYMDWKKMRTDAKWNVWGINVAMSTITKDGYTYTRNENEKEGWKMIDEDDDDMNYDNNMYDGEEDMDNVTLKCKKWISDRSVFDLPAGVTFNEMPEFDL